MRVVIFAVLTAGSVAFAQPRPVPTGAVGAYHGGAVVPPNVGSPGLHSRPVGSPRPYVPPPPIAHPQHSRNSVVYYPVFYGGYYYGYDPSANGAPAPGYDSGAGYAAPSDSPVVVLSQNYRDALPPVARDYSEPPPEPTMKVYDAAASEQPLVYLIAMKDHTIFPTVAYWVEGDTLCYVTTEGSPNRASLDLVDREFSRQLNDERHVEFKLPSAR